jgi:hypothetical protein
MATTIYFVYLAILDNNGSEIDRFNTKYDNKSNTGLDQSVIDLVFKRVEGRTTVSVSVLLYKLNTTTGEQVLHKEVGLVENNWKKLFPQLEQLKGKIKNGDNVAELSKLLNGMLGR